MRSLNAHIDAYKLQREMRDEESWINGQYMLSAVSVAVEHCLSGKKAKSKYIEEPIMKTAKKQQELEKLDEDNKKNMINHLFTQLQVRQANFELSHSKQEDTQT